MFSLLKSLIGDPEELCEAPYIMDGDHYHQMEYDDTFISSSALAREFKELPLSDKSRLVRFYLRFETNQVIGVISKPKPITNQDSNLIIFDLTFKRNVQLKVELAEFRNAIQVSSVYTEKNYRSYGYASKVYRYLVKHGFTIISDCDQFIPGKKLWEKLSQEAHAYGLQVNIVSVDGDIMRDQKGHIIDYDGSNIAEDKIWSERIEDRRDEILLALREKSA